MAVTEQELNILYQQLQDTRLQLAETRQRSAEMSRQFQNEIDALSRRMQESTANAQAEILRRWRELEANMCRTYVLEVENMRKEYQSLLDTVKTKEIEYEKAFRELQKEQKQIIAERDRKNDRIRALTIEQSKKLEQALRCAEKEPIEAFFPHRLESYRQAGERALQLMQEGLYTLAMNDFSNCCLGVENLTEDTRKKVNDIDVMFTLYKSMMSQIHLLQDNAWELKDDSGEVCLVLDRYFDKEYWADTLYMTLNKSIEEHRQIAEAGPEVWIRQSVGKGISPELLLDQKIRALEYIPDQLQICISYALSACDSYNELSGIFDRVKNIMCEQNYRFEKITYGRCRDANATSEGYQYYRRWLEDEECLDADGTPDYREVRCICFRNMLGDDCKIFMIPIRNADNVGYRLYLKSDAEYLPTNVQNTLLNVLSTHLNKEVLLYDSGEIHRLSANRIMTSDELKSLAAVPSEDKLKAKYCVGL